MDVLMLILLAVLIVGLAYLKFNLPTIKGKIGEKSVAAALSFLPKNEYIILNDVMLNNGQHSTQIDHIVISIHGIFVIETKNYKGWILGNINKDYWTQNIWGNKYPLYNPVIQNQNHIKFLIHKFSILREKEQWIYPIVVFLGTSELHISGSCGNVLRLSELNTYIRSYTPNIMTINDCNYISSIIQQNNIEDKKGRKIHTANVYAAKFYHETKVNNKICPMCGGRLIQRTGKYGTFYGCSNYPRCKYTHQ